MDIPFYGDASNHVGSIYNDLTIAYPPQALSTEPCGFVTPKAINYQDFNSPPYWSVVSSNDDCDPGFAGAVTTSYPGSDFAYGYTIHPQLLMPPELQTYDPAWSLCTLDVFGAYDPPHALSKVAALINAGTTIATSAADPTAQPASPSSSPAAIPEQTSTKPSSASPQPTSTSEDPNLQPVVPSTTSGNIKSSVTATAGETSPINQVSNPTPSPSTVPSYDPGNTSSSTTLNPSVDPQTSNSILQDPNSGGASVDPGQSNSVKVASSANVASIGTNAGETLQALSSEAVPVPTTYIQPGSGDTGVGGVQNSQNPTGVAAGGTTAVPITEDTSLPLSSIALINGQPLQIASNGGIIVGSSTLQSGAQTTIGGADISVGNGNAVIAGTTVPLIAAQASSPPIITGHQIEVAPNGGAIIDGSSLAPGSQVTIAGIPVSAGTSQVVVGSSTYTLPTPAPAPLPVIAGQQITTNPSGALLVGSETIVPGIPTIIAGTPISLGASNIVVGTSTFALPSTVAPPLQIVTAASQTFTALPNGAIAIDGSTLSPGSPARIISGSAISIASSAIIIGSSTIPFPTSATADISQTITLVGETFTVYNDGSVKVAGTVLSAGGAAITVSGTAISVAASGLVIGSSTFPLATASAQVITTLGQPFTLLSNNAVAVAGTTLTPGSPALTISGTIISVGSAGLILGSSTLPLPSLPSQIITTLGQQFTLLPNNLIAVAGTTLSPGSPPLTISGTIISLNPSGLILGSSTLSLSFPPSTSTSTSTSTGLGSFITSAFGTPTGVVEFEGQASKVRVRWWEIGMVVLGGWVGRWGLWG
ncbi:hypothetical protein MMC12_006876 [Toensbergia leucococca]|nr:hypothetical protein [Toensbergia leucococca]